MTIASPLIAIAVILGLGIGAQWVAWRLRLPSILLMLAAGLAIGPISVLVFGPDRGPVFDPDALFGDLLLPLVSLSVGLILYEGGLTLRFKEVSGVGVVVWRLVTLGALVTWVVASVGGYFVLGMGARVAVLFGAILVVTGPTVIGPLLRQMRPRGEGGAILRWEGIVIDPIGALLAVLVFEVIAATHDGGDAALGAILKSVALTVVVGGGLGVIAAVALVEILRRYWAPEYLQNPLSLLLASLAFVASNAVQHESGLLATTVMGMVLANQTRADVRHIIEFKENLRVLLLAALFVTLGARVSADDLGSIGWSSLAFAAILIFVARPLGVLTSTLGTSLAWEQRALIAAVAPRGIVAAAIASVFAIQLEGLGEAGASTLATHVFAVILTTVAWYGLTAGRVARRLGIADHDPQGVLFIGASPWVRHVAITLQERGVRVRVADSNYSNVSAARLQGLNAWYGNALGEHATQEIDMTGIGRVIAVTPNDEVNTLVAQRFGRLVGREHVYQLAAGEARRGVSRELQGRRWVADDASFSSFAKVLGGGGLLKVTTLSDEFTYRQFRTLYGNARVLFVLSGKNRVSVVSTDKTLAPETGSTLISIVDPDELLMPWAGDEEPDTPREAE